MDGRIPARIVATHKDRYEIVCDKGNGFAKIKRGCFYDNPNSIYPTTGDFVLIEWNENGELSQDRFNSYIRLQNEARYNNDSESYLKEKKEKFKTIAKYNKKR